MQNLQGFQKKFLKGAAHNLQPVVMVGHRGITKTLLQTTHANLNAHELIKVKFIEFKEKSQKTRIAADLATQTGSHLVGIIGHVAILFRPHPDPDKRTIVPPKRTT